MAVTATIVPGTVSTDGVTVWGSVRVEADSSYLPPVPEGQPAPEPIAVAVEYAASTPRRNPDGSLKTNVEIRAGLFAAARLMRRRDKQLENPKSSLAVTGTADIE